MNPMMKKLLLEPQGIVKRGLVGLYDFTDPAGSQVLTDKSGYGNHGRNGTDAGVDTNDVTFDGNYGYFTTDDYIILPIFPAVYNFTAIVVAQKSDAVTAEKHLFDLSGSQLYCSNGKVNGLTTGTVASLNVGTPYNWHMYGLRQSEMAGYDVILDDAISNKVSGSQTPIMPGSSYLGRYYSSANLFWEGKIAFALSYRVHLEDREIKQIYKVLKKLMAQRGIGI